MAGLFDSLPACDSKNAATLLKQLADREALIVQYAEQGALSFEWARLDVSGNGHTLIVYVARDGVKLDGVRLSMSATCAQQVADRIDAVLPTPRLHDQIYAAADVKLAPITRNDWVQNSSMATTAHMRDQSNAIDAAIGERSGLVADLGKDWVLVNSLMQPTNGCGPGWPPLAVGVVAANYGWEVSSGGDPAVTPGMRVIQSVGRCHGRTHCDYSQVQRLVATTCELDGAPTDLRDVLQSDAVASLVSSEGPLVTVRQPGVPSSGAAPASGTLPSTSSSSSSSSGSAIGTGLGTFALAFISALGFGTAAKVLG